MDRIFELFKLLGIFFSLLQLCSRVMADSISPQLPADVAMNEEAGRGGWLIVMLHLQSSEDLPFIVDTGCPTTLFDRSLEPKLGKRLDTKTVWMLNGKQQAGIYEAPKLYLGSTPLMTGSNVFTSDYLRACLETREDFPIRLLYLCEEFRTSCGCVIPLT